MVAQGLDNMNAGSNIVVSGQPVKINFISHNCLIQENSCKPLIK